LVFERIPLKPPVFLLNVIFIIIGQGPDICGACACMAETMDEMITNYRLLYQ